jgi:hypothetical protein
MEKENSKLITESEDTFRAALAINRLANKPPNERWELFKGPIFKAVKDVLQDVDQAEESGDWRYIIVWIKNGKYALHLNYDWHSAAIEREGDKPDFTEEKRIAGKMCNGAWRFFNYGYQLIPKAVFQEFQQSLFP